MLEAFWDSVADAPSDIGRQIEAKDASGLRDKAHWVKGAASSAGAGDLTELLQSLEAAASSEDWDLIDGLAGQVNERLDEVRRDILGGKAPEG